MDAKISVTTRCNAQCVTCPVWEYRGEDMTVDHFILMWQKLISSTHIDRILLNNTGDMYIHPDRYHIFDYVEANLRKPVIMTTNAAAMDYIPRIHELIISFNGGTKETYEATTGLDFDETVERVKSRYSEIAQRVQSAEIHCLMWEGNAGTEDALKALWADFPGRVRVSYKYDNQMREDRTIEGYRATERVACDYLNMVCIWPNGQVIQCAHDFKGLANWGNIFEDSIYYIVTHVDRQIKQKEHSRGEYLGLCQDCNYNTGIGGRVIYLK